MLDAMSIIALLVGLVAGSTVMFLIIVLTGAGAGKKAEKLLNEAKKEADKHKRDSLLELKEESFKLKEKKCYKIEITCLNKKIII